MDCQKTFILLAIGVLAWSGLGRTAEAQTGRAVDTPGRVTEVSAQELGKLFAPDTPEPAETYRGRVLRVGGRVSMHHKPFLYLGTGSRFPTGQPVLVSFEDKAGALPEVAVGDQVVMEGRFDRKGIFGPILTEPRLVRRVKGGEAVSAAPPASRPTRAANRKGRAAKKALEKSETEGQVPPVDPRAVVLRFGGPVREGESGYRPECTSFRLRFGPGKWRGTVIGRSIAWGDGNQNQDHWGVGSGEGTFSSEVHQDGADGASFVFSLNGTDWESERVIALFRLTLPDGRPGLATAVIPVR